MVFGDSNAYRPGNTEDCWPSMLQHEGRNNLWVINESCDGRTTQYDTGECNGLKVVEKKIRNAWPLEYVLVALGTNDVKDKYGPPGATEVVAGIAKIITIIKTTNGGAKPILLTPPPLGNVICGELAGAQDRIPPVVAEYHRYANTQNIPIVDLYSTIYRDGDLEPDFTHLNHVGRRKVANIVCGNLRGAYLPQRCKNWRASEPRRQG